MMRTKSFKIVICALLIASVATILITPDQSDDVPGVLHHLLKAQKFVATWVSLFTFMPVVAAHVFTPVVSASVPVTPQLLTLLCVRLC